MNYWYPKVAGLPGIKTPKTLIVPCDAAELTAACYDGKDLDPDFIFSLQQFGRQFGYPLFMRTDLCSAKHDWENSCFVQSEDVLESHLGRLIEYNELADIMGLPYTSIVLREFLQLETSFESFWGRMPINKERRYFVNESKVICHHPYWPAEAFEDQQNSTRDWQRHLDILNSETEDEIQLLTAQAELVGKTLGGFWSIDFAKTKSDGWYLIDMAVGQASYHWPTCQNASMRKFE